MTDENQTAETEVIEAQEAEEAQEQPEVETTDGEQGEETTEESDLEITFDDGSPPEEAKQERAPEWVRELRKANKELKRENKQLKEKTQQSEASLVELGEKPTLEQFDYDSQKFEASLTQWYEKKREVDAHNAKLQQQQEAEQKSWQERLNSYEQSKQDLKVSDYEDAELTVTETLSEQQQAMILQGAIEPSHLVYALGKNEAKVKELALIKDPVKFAFAIARLEAKLKVSPRKASTSPEKRVTGSAPNSGVVDSTLEKLREEAARTGDMTKVIRYKREQRLKA